MRLGVAFFFTGIGALIGTPIGGALLTNQFLWWRLALFSGVRDCHSGSEVSYSTNINAITANVECGVLPLLRGSHHS